MATDYQGMMDLIKITVPELKKNDVVHFYTGTFRVLEDALVTGDPHADGVATAKGLCLTGNEGAYFYPGSTWHFRGNSLATEWIEPRE